VKRTLCLVLGFGISVGALGACGDGTVEEPRAEAGGTPAPAGSGGTRAPDDARPGGMSSPSDVTGPGSEVPAAVDGPGEQGNPPVMGGLAGAVGENAGEGDGQAAGEEPVAPSDCTLGASPVAPLGYGAATTGGGSAAPVNVSSFAEAQAALDVYRDAFEEGTASALVLRYTGSFDYSTISDVCAQHTLEPQVLEVKEMENVTLEGAPGSSANFGVHINRARNVIVRNMTLGLLQGGDGSDAITIEGNGTNGDVEQVWIDHNELFSSTKDDCDGAGDTEFDGLIDIKKGARNITVSFNYLHDHQKTGLLGFSDSDATDRYVTFHHNRYENVVSRTPLHRSGFVHIFNNYYGRILGSGINVRMGGVALIESNFFEEAANPVTSRFSDVVGFWDLRNNHVGAGITWTTESDTLANAEDWQSTTRFPEEELSYAVVPDVAACVKQLVLANAGATL
jgi:pectate lyase